VGKDTIEKCMGNVDQVKLSTYFISRDGVEKTEDKFFYLDPSISIRDAIYIINSEVIFL